MPLDAETRKHLLRIKEQIEEILEDVGDVVPPDFRTTCLLRYCGANPDVDDMVWTDDVVYDAIAALERHGEKVESV